jgi:hypothetical protein
LLAGAIDCESGSGYARGGIGRDEADAMNFELLLLGGGLVIAAVITLWVALPGADRISRQWLRSEAGGLYPLIPVVLFVFGVFTLMKSVGLA